MVFSFSVERGTADLEERLVRSSWDFEYFKESLDWYRCYLGRLRCHFIPLCKSAFILKYQCCIFNAYYTD